MGAKWRCLSLETNEWVYGVEVKPGDGENYDILVLENGDEIEVVFDISCLIYPETDKDGHILYALDWVTVECYIEFQGATVLDKTIEAQLIIFDDGLEEGLWNMINNETQDVWRIWELQDIYTLVYTFNGYPGK